MPRLHSTPLVSARLAVHCARTSMRPASVLMMLWHEGRELGCVHGYCGQSKACSSSFPTCRGLAQGLWWPLEARSPRRRGSLALSSRGRWT
eukprot:252398-Alexandrium_andersonii.AAC.1